MKQFKRNFIAVCSMLFSLLLAGCTIDLIVFEGSDKLSFPADGGTESITFETSESWTATVESTSPADENDWVGIDRYSGEAGANTVKITVRPNFGTSERKAVFSIFCGGDVQVVSVVQNAAEQGGGTGDSSLISRITEKEAGGNSEFVTDFEYDGDRLVKITSRSYDDGIEDDSEVIALNWEDGMVKIVDKISDDYDSDTYYSDISLDEHGRAKRSFNKEDYDSYTIDFSYDSDGCLSQASGDDGVNYHYYWSGGNLKSSGCTGGGGYDYTEEFLYSEYENNANLDLNWLFTEGYAYDFDGPYVILGIAGLLGKRSANYVVPCCLAAYEVIAPEAGIPADGEYTFDATSGLIANDEAKADYKFTEGKLVNVVCTIPEYEVVTTYRVYRKITDYSDYYETPDGQKLYYHYEQTILSSTQKSKTKTGSIESSYDIEY